MPRENLMLHVDAANASRDEVFEVETPEPTDTWYPVSHRSLIEKVHDHLNQGGFKVEGERYGLTKDGARMFGVLDLCNKGPENDYRWVVGIRNSHDKRFPAGMAVGTTVFVCDNTSFCGSIKLARRHTRYIERDLPHMIAKAVGRFGSLFYKQDQRIQSYKDTELNDKDASHLLVQALVAKAITSQQLPQVLERWQRPTFEEFEPRTAWSLFNGFTEVYRASPPALMAARSEALHGIFDQLIR